MDQKRVRYDFFGMLGFWIDVLDDLAKEYFFSSKMWQKCGENSNISVLGAFFPYIAPPRYPGGQEVGFLT